MSFKDKFMEKLNMFAGKMSANIYISAIKNAFIANMPLLITGSFATLGSSVLCSTTSGLAQFSGFGFLEQFSTLFSTINYACINLLAFYICFLIGGTVVVEGLVHIGGIDLVAVQVIMKCFQECLPLLVTLL